MCVLFRNHQYSLSKAVSCCLAAKFEFCLRLNSENMWGKQRFSHVTPAYLMSATSAKTVQNR